jgi:hypothetical protein
MSDHRSTESTGDVEGAVERWSEGLEEETEFWLRWLRDHGGPWQDDYALRTDAQSELQPHIRRYLASPDDSHLRILDVGSGLSHGPRQALGRANARHHRR